MKLPRATRNGLIATLIVTSVAAYGLGQRKLSQLESELQRSTPLIKHDEPVEPIAIEKQYQQSVIAIEPNGQRTTDTGSLVLSFPRAAFGSLLLAWSEAAANHRVEFILGERLTADGHVWQHQALDRVNEISVGSVRVSAQLSQGSGKLVVPLPYRPHPTRSALPNGFSGVTPFQFVEIVGLQAKIDEGKTRQLMVQQSFPQPSTQFETSDSVLQDVWELCRHTLVATSFAGISIDGDRERLPYEADAYIGQLGLFGVHADASLARTSLRHLLKHPTWPTEWSAHLIFMAHHDFMETADLAFLKSIYPRLHEASMVEASYAEGLIGTPPALPDGTPREHIIDWPPQERAGFPQERRETLLFLQLSLKAAAQQTLALLGHWTGYPLAARTYEREAERSRYARTRPIAVNAVVNAFHYEGLRQMAELSTALGQDRYADTYRLRSETVRTAYQQAFWDGSKGLVRDGRGLSRYSYHANLFALRFGLVPQGAERGVVQHLMRAGMAGSPYAAQYLLDTLYENDQAQAALQLITAKSERSWWAMMHRVGSTMTTEAWNAAIKPNMDWNHVWSTAPANIIPRRLMGLRPILPGYREFIIDPRLAALAHARIDLPTERGRIRAEYRQQADTLRAQVTVPPGSTGWYRARSVDGALKINGVDAKPERSGPSHGDLHRLLPGSHVIEERRRRD